MTATTNGKPAAEKTPTLKRQPKAKNAPAKKTMPAPKKSQSKTPKITTLADLAEAYPEHLLKIGKSAGTASSYRGDIRVACRHFGENTKLTALTERKVKGYFESDLVRKTRKGEPKNPITSSKLCRVFRLGLMWVAEEGCLEQAPIPGDYLPKSIKSE